MARAIIDVRDLSAEDVLKVEQFMKTLREKARQGKNDDTGTSGAGKDNQHDDDKAG